MEVKQPAEYNKVIVAIGKAPLSESGLKEFDLYQYKQTTEPTSGSRAEGKRKMMWEGEYIEWTMSAKCGHISRIEATREWERLSADQDLKRDHKGRHGSLRLSILKGDYDTDFEELKQRDGGDVP